MNTKNNQRYKENEQKIIHCFIELLNQMDISQITIRMICEKAGINRTTFYKHYQDIFDLLEKLEKKMNNEIYSEAKNKVNSESLFISIDFFIPFLIYMKNHQAFYRASLQKRNQFPISEGFEGLFETIVKPLCLKNGITSKDDMIYYFIFYQAGITMIFRRWVEKGCKESPEKIAQLLVNCMRLNTL